jgi:hypothetical protein
MLWQAESGMRFRMPEGNFVASAVTSINATGPPASRLSNMVESIQAGAPPPVVDPSLRAQAASDMENSRIDFVIVGPMDYRPSMIRFFSQLYSHDPEQVHGVALWRGLPTNS